MDIKNVTVVGAGVLGSQIAFQAAFFGFKVTLYDINDEAVKAGQEKLQKLVPIYADYFNNEKLAQETLNKIKITSDLEASLKDSDLMIEAIPELFNIKVDFYKSVANLAPEKTIFATNSSTMMPSQFREYTGREEKFLALHFANEVWKNNTGEVMGHDRTHEQYVQDVLTFAAEIGMIPIHVKKEQPGYVLNSLLVPLLQAAEQLYAHGIADIETIDRTWMAATGAPLGPFAILDVVGLNTAYNIATASASANPAMHAVAEMLKKDYVDKGNLGTSTGEGFYKYPNPSYREENFVKKTMKKRDKGDA